MGGINWKAIAERTSVLANDWRDEIPNKFKQKRVSIMLDGWTNPISKNHHLCYFLKINGKIFYWSGVVINDKTAANIKSETMKVIDQTEGQGDRVATN